jgi:acetyltransferase-like isoleucine patch superfamily enzyme
VKAIVSPNIRIRHPDHFQVGADSIVDDYCYFSTRVVVGRCSHIASGCSVAGGIDRTFRLGDFSSLSSGVKVWCVSDDFVNDVVAIVPADIPSPKTHLIVGDVTIGNYTAVGSNTVVMPGNSIPDGTVVGALSFVPSAYDFQPWSVYAGNPVRRLRARNQDNVLAQVELLRAALSQRSDA